jgi:sulfate-transporting ATPase
VALCRLLLSKPDMLLLDEPTNHLDAESVDWLEQFLQRFTGTVVAITHDRYFLDNAAEWILELDRGPAFPTRATTATWLEQKEARLEQEQKGEDARAKAMKKELEWSRQNPKAPPGQEQGAPGPLRGTVGLRIPEAQRDAGDLHPRGRAPGQRGDRVQERQQVLRRPPADRQPELQGARRRHRRHHRPQRRGQVDAVQDDRRQGEARQRRGQDRPDGADGLRRPDTATTWPTNKTVWEDVSGGLDILTVGKFQMASRAYCGRFNFNGGDQQKRWACCPAASAAACTWPRR